MGKGVAHSPSAIDIRSAPWTLLAGSDEGDGPPPSPKDASDDTAAEPGKPRLLVVEDDYLLALDLTETVRRFGYEVCGVAATGANAIAVAREQAPDLILKSEEHTSELPSLLRISYAVFCLKKKRHRQQIMCTSRTCMRTRTYYAT